MLNDLMREEKRREVSEYQKWSKLCSDILRPILESLSALDFHRARTVCSDWYSVGKTCMKRPFCPWQMIYRNSCLMLYDPGEDKLYKRALVGYSDDSYYMASYGNWLFMVDTRLDFYIFNLLTCKRINLPSMESSIRGGKVRFERSSKREQGEWGHFVEPCRKNQMTQFNILGLERSAVLWIDERTEDFVVAWIFKKHYLFTYKKGDDSWWNWNSDWNIEGPNISFVDLAFKNSMLYLYTHNDHIKIIDFSGGCPKEVISKNPYRDRPFYYLSKPWEYIYGRRMAIQKSGEVLIILRLRIGVRIEARDLFYVLKMNLESSKWERVDSIGDDEMLIFGHGVTIRAPSQDVGDGTKSNSIFFVNDDFWLDSGYSSKCGIYDLSTRKTTWHERLSNSWKIQWFVPRFLQF